MYFIMLSRGFTKKAKKKNSTDTSSLTTIRGSEEKPQNAHKKRPKDDARFEKDVKEWRLDLDPRRDVRNEPQPNSGTRVGVRVVSDLAAALEETPPMPLNNQPPQHSFTVRFKECQRGTNTRTATRTNQPTHHQPTNQPTNQR